MPNLPKPRLRRTDRSVELAPAAPAAAAEPNVEIVQGEGLRWINIERPTATEWAWLGEHFEFHMLDLEDVASRNQRPKIDEYPDYLFIVLHLPVFDRKGRLAHRGGLVAPGLYTLGLPFMRRRNSALIDGVGADAAFVADHIANTRGRLAA